MSGRVGSLGTLCLVIVFASSRAAAQEVALPTGAAQAINANDWQTVAQLQEPHLASITPTEPSEEPQWKWFLSLMEPIHSLYLGRSGDKYLLRVEDEHATVVAEGSNLEHEARRWQRQLTALMQERGGQGVQGS